MGSNCGTQQVAGDVAGFENCGGPPMGLLAYPGMGLVSNDSIYAAIAKRNKPASITGASAIIRWNTLAEACLRARGLIYSKSNPGDCPAPSSIGGIGSAQIVGLSGTAASGVVGGLGAAGVLAGPATLGISTAVSVAVSAISSIFTHHAQAVANEQATICQVAGYFNPLLKQIDAAVRSGQITCDQAQLYVKQVANQAINGLQSILQECNAACWYVGVLKAHIDLAVSLYPLIAPPEAIGPAAPGASPDFFGTPPGGVNAGSNISGNTAPPPPYRSTWQSVYSPAGPDPVSGLAPTIQPNRLLPSGCYANCNPDYLTVGYNQQTGQSGQAADVPPPGMLCQFCIFFLVAALIVALVVFA